MHDSARPSVERAPLNRIGVKTLADHALLYGAVLLALAPAGFLVISSFNLADLGQPFRFGFDGWLQALSSSTTLGSIGTSLILALRVLPGLAIALLISWALVRRSIPGRTFIEGSLWFAFFLPPVPMAIAWTLLLHPAYGLINQALAYVPMLPRPFFSIQTIPGIMWVHLTVSTVPFLVIVLTPAIRQLDAAFEEAARVNGANPLQTALRVIGPMLAPAMLVGLIATYTRGLESFEVEQIIGPPIGIFVFTTRIYDLIREDPPLLAQAMALACLFLLVLAVLVVIQLRWMRQSSAVATIRTQSQRTVRPPRTRLALVILATAICGYLAISVYLPLATLIVGSFNKIFGFFGVAQPWTTEHWTRVLLDSRFDRAVVNTVLLGIAAGLLFLPVYLRIAWILARTEVRGRAAAMLVLWLPWAIPGFAFGLTLLQVMLRIDLFAPLYGTFVPVIVALFIKELPLGVHLLRVALVQAGRQLEDAARVAGAGNFTAFRKITLPLVSSTVVSVFILIFVSVAREISTIVLVAGPNTETVSLLMFNYATSGQNESAAVVGVLFAVLAVPLAFLFRGRIVAEGLR